MRAPYMNPRISGLQGQVLNPVPLLPIKGLIGCKVRGFEGLGFGAL